jgi:hypothetical protein
MLFGELSLSLSSFLARPIAFSTSNPEKENKNQRDL